MIYTKVEDALALIQIGIMLGDYTAKAPCSLEEITLTIHNIFGIPMGSSFIETRDKMSAIIERMNDESEIH